MADGKKTDAQTKEYFKLLRKLEKLFETILRDRISEENKRQVVLCLAETYFGAKHLIEYIDKTSEINLDYTEKDLDALLGLLIDTKLRIYHEMVDWFKELKKPLNVAIDKVGEIGAERYDWE